MVNPPIVKEKDERRERRFDDDGGDYGGYGGYDRDFRDFRGDFDNEPRGGNRDEEESRD